MHRHLPLLYFLFALSFTTNCNTPIPTAAIAPTATASITPLPQPATPMASPTPSGKGFLGITLQDVVYCTAEDVALTMDIKYPDKSTGAPFPIALNIHGGSWSGGDKTKSESAADISELIARGYVVAAVNYRLAPKYKFPAQIQDVKCAVRFLRANAQKYFIDPKHIGAWGCSAGGHLAALLGVTDPSNGFEGTGAYLDQSSRVQAVALLSAPTDITLYDAVARAEMLKHVFGSLVGINPVLVKASPTTFVSPDDPPFLIVQGDKDHVVTSQHGERLYDKLAAAQVPAQLITVKNGGHCLPSNPALAPSRAEVTKQIGDFFDRYLH